MRTPARMHAGTHPYAHTHTAIRAHTHTHARTHTHAHTHPAMHGPCIGPLSLGRTLAGRLRRVLLHPAHLLSYHIESEEELCPCARPPLLLHLWQGPVGADPCTLNRALGMSGRVPAQAPCIPCAATFSCTGWPGVWVTFRQCPRAPS